MKVAVVGVGDMGQTHLRATLAGKVATEVAGCELADELRNKVGKSLNIPMFEDVPTLLSQFKPQAVVIATAPSAHAEVARACFERGVAVLTEKPIASTLEESEALVDLAEARKVPFQCGFQMRYCGVMRALQSVLDAGTLGKLSHIALTQISGPHPVRGYMSRARTGGIFFEKHCHLVDFFRFLLGEPLCAIAIAAPNLINHYEIHDNLVAVFEFKNDAQGTISYNTRRAAQVDGTCTPERKFEGREAGHFYELVVSGEQGSAAYDPWSETLDVVRFNHRDDLLNERVRLIRVRDEFGEPSYDQKTQDNDFFERVAAGKTPRFPASDALKSMRWTEKAEESLRRGGEWVS